MRQDKFALLTNMPENTIPEPVYTEKMAKVDKLLAIAQTNGVNVTLMASLEELCPEAISPNIPINTYTEEFSTINLTYALESFDKAIHLLAAIPSE